ncbi:hypothetical protein C9374_014226, partial [Naegleria lovaniensis]
YLIKKQQTMKELEEKKKASPIYQMVNPFMEWIQIYPNYLWFPFVVAFALIVYLIFLLVLRFCVARYVQKKRKQKIKLYLKEKKEMREKLKKFLPPKFREESMTEEEELDQDSDHRMIEERIDERIIGQQKSLHDCSRKTPKEMKRTNHDLSDSEDEQDEEDNHSLEHKKFIPKNSINNCEIIERNDNSNRNHEERMPSTQLPQPILKSRPLPNPRSYHSPSTRFQPSSLSHIQINIQDIGASSQRMSTVSLASSSSSNKRKKALPNPLSSSAFGSSAAAAPKGTPQVGQHSVNSLNNAPQNDVDTFDISKHQNSSHTSQTQQHPSKHSNNNPGSRSRTELPKRPKYLVCGKCGAMARVWCHSCEHYLCIDCDQKDETSHSERSKSKVMICDHCMQPRSELKEHFLKGSNFKLYGCKKCMEELYKERKVNRVGSIVKRCTKCMDEEISKTNPQLKLCDNCIYFSHARTHQSIK